MFFSSMKEKKIMLISENYKVSSLNMKKFSCSLNFVDFMTEHVIFRDCCKEGDEPVFIEAISLPQMFFHMKNLSFLPKTLSIDITFSFSLIFLQ